MNSIEQLQSKIKALEFKTDLLISILGKTLNGIELSENEIQDIQKLYNFYTLSYERRKKVIDAQNKALDLKEQLRILEQDYPELKNINE